MMNNDAIIQKIIAGNIELFELLLEQYKNRVGAIVGKRIPPSDHEIVVQEVFVNIFRSLERFSPKYKFENWLTVIAVRTCCDYWRRYHRKRRLQIVQLQDDDNRSRELLQAGHSLREFQEQEQRRELAERMRLLLEQLPPEDRMLVELIYFEELALQEVADILEWKLSRVKVRAMRARKKLRKLYEVQIKAAPGGT